MIHLVAKEGRNVIRPPRITLPQRVIDREAISADWEQWAEAHRRKLWRAGRVAFSVYEETGLHADLFAAERAFNLFAVSVR